MKHKKSLIFLIILLVLALSAGGVWFFSWRASLPPKGQVRVTLLKLAEDSGGNVGSPFGSMSNISVSSSDGKGQRLGYIEAVTDTGKKVSLPYFDRWFEGAELLDAKQFGDIRINKFVQGGVFDAQIGKNGLIVCRYLIDGEEIELPVGEGSCLLYTQEGNTLTLGYVEQPEVIRQLWADLREGTGAPVIGWE